jgi:hypothetical protein
MATTEVNLRNRAWMLGLVVMAYWAGLRPLSKQNAHALVFLANSLAPIYDDTGIETRVIKHEHGPFYPDAQWDLDRMVGQGLLAISDVRFSQTGTRWWLDAAYLPTASGREAFARCRELPLLKRSTRFLIELTNAFASLSKDTRDRAALEDAIYAIPGRPNLSALVFENSEDNYSAMTANAFDELVGDEVYLSPKERLQLYFGYLGQRVETIGGARS